MGEKSHLINQHHADKCIIGDEFCKFSRGHLLVEAAKDGDCNYEVARNAGENEDEIIFNDCTRANLPM